MDKARLLEYLRAQFEINWHGHHGGSHWARVRVNGALLARDNRADPHVVELFSFFHDSRRLSEYRDSGHGFRGFQLAQRLRGQYFQATDLQMAMLRDACEGHSDGGTVAGPTVMTCWDADRLDIGRTGRRPLPELLCTDAGRDAIEAAHARAMAWVNGPRRPPPEPQERDRGTAGAGRDATAAAYAKATAWVNDRR